MAEDIAIKIEDAPLFEGMESKSIPWASRISSTSTLDEISSVVEEQNRAVAASYVDNSKYEVGLKLITENKSWIKNYADDETLYDWHSKGAIGVLEAMDRFNKYEMIPVLGAATVLEDINIMKIMKKSQESPKSLTGEEQQKLNEFIIDMAEIEYRGYSIGGHIVNGVFTSIPFMGEFVLSGLSLGASTPATGTATATRATAKAGKTGIKSALKAGAKRIVRKELGTGVKAFALDSVLRSAKTSYRLPKLYQQRRLNDSLAFSDTGFLMWQESQESPYKTFAKATAELWSRTASELTGKYVFSPLTQAMIKKIPAGKLANITKRADDFYRTNLGMSIRKAKETIGLENIVEESLEERAEGFLRYVFNLDDQDYNLDQLFSSVFPTTKDEVLIEGGVLLGGQLIGVSTGTLFQKVLAKNPNMAPEQRVELLNNIEGLTESEKVNNINEFIARETAAELAEYNAVFTQWQHANREVITPEVIDKAAPIIDVGIRGLAKAAGVSYKAMAVDMLPLVTAKQIDGKGGFSRIDGKNIINIANADRSTFMHESSHMFLNGYLRHAPDKLDAIFKWAKVSKKPITELTKKEYTQLQERFANAFEQYLLTGKAPTPKLKESFDAFREWFIEIYKDLRGVVSRATDGVGIEVSKDVVKFFDDMLDFKEGEGVVKSITPQEREQAVLYQKALEDLRSQREKAIDSGESAESIDGKISTIERNLTEPMREYLELQAKGISEDIYKQNLEINNKLNRLESVVAGAKENVKSASRLSSRAFVPISTQLGGINPKLRNKLREFEFNTLEVKKEHYKQIRGFLEKYSKLTEGDANYLDYALKISDINKVNEIIDKNGMRDEFTMVTNALEKIYDQALEVGMDIGYLSNYFPRRVEKSLEFMSYLQETEHWSMIKKDIEAKEKQIGYKMDEAERAEYVNSFLRGFAGGKALLSRPSYTKGRELNILTPRMNQFYKDSSQSLIDYIRVMTEAIEARKLFGRSEQSMTESIGAVVSDMVKEGQIDYSQEQLARELLITRFNSKGISGIWNLYKTTTYMTLLGSPTSAITQLEDIGMTMYKTGVFDSFVGLAKSITGRQDITIKDLGVESISQEFVNEKTGQKAMNRLFKITGFEKMDRLGKESFVNASLNKFKRLAKANNVEFNQKLSEIFGGEAEQTRQDLANGIMTRNVRYLMFCELAEIQPLTLSEMPPAYVQGGNLRLLYTLKSFTIKRLDAVRRIIIEDVGKMKKGDASGLVDLGRLSFSLVLMGATTDYIKDFLLGREPEPTDYMVDNLLKMFGLGKWLMYKARNDGLMSALAAQILPPFKLTDDLYKDMLGDKDVADWRAWSNLPLVGKFWFWWYGGGSN